MIKYLPPQVPTKIINSLKSVPAEPAIIPYITHSLAPYINPASLNDQIWLWETFFSDYVENDSDERSKYDILKYLGVYYRTLISRTTPSVTDIERRKKVAKVWKALELKCVFNNKEKSTNVADNSIEILEILSFSLFKLKILTTTRGNRSHGKIYQKLGTYIQRYVESLSDLTIEEEDNPSNFLIPYNEVNSGDTTLMTNDAEDFVNKVSKERLDVYTKISDATTDRDKLPYSPTDHEKTKSSFIKTNSHKQLSAFNQEKSRVSSKLIMETLQAPKLPRAKKLSAMKNCY